MNARGDNYFHEDTLHENNDTFSAHEDKYLYPLFAQIP